MRDPSQKSYQLPVLGLRTVQQIVMCLAMEMLKTRMCFWKGKSSMAAVETGSEMQTHAEEHLLSVHFL